MPYINQERRDDFECEDPDFPGVSGELNFVLTKIIKEYWDLHGPAYQTINDIVGALEGAKLEFYRRIAVPYEDEKIKQNGDVY